MSVFSLGQTFAAHGDLGDIVGQSANWQEPIFGSVDAYPTAILGADGALWRTILGGTYQPEIIDLGDRVLNLRGSADVRLFEIDNTYRARAALKMNAVIQETEFLLTHPVHSVPRIHLAQYSYIHPAFVAYTQSVYVDYRTLSSTADMVTLYVERAGYEGYKLELRLSGHPVYRIVRTCGFGYSNLTIHVPAANVTSSTLTRSFTGVGTSTYSNVHVPGYSRSDSMGTSAYTLDASSGSIEITSTLDPATITSYTESFAWPTIDIINTTTDSGPVPPVGSGLNLYKLITQSTYTASRWGIGGRFGIGPWTVGADIGKR